jgi:response regulator RpfG family c-di-GMP phosphodiesterase
MERILCVDDDSNILDAYKRALRKDFQIDTAEGGELGLELVRSKPNYAVIVSDMRMPGMDGVQFLSQAAAIAPDTVRMMLTGNADQNTAIEAVNQGQIFRFLNKPCSPDTLKSSLHAGIKQYHLIRSEKDLLEKTLKGSLQVLTDVLSMVNPTAFGRASRVRRLVAQLAEIMKVPDSWQLEIAAMLSQIGYITVPEETLEKIYKGRELSVEESRMVENSPKVGHDLISRIPRMDQVARIIGCQRDLSKSTVVSKDVPVSALVLQLALDFDKLIEAKKTSAAALDEIAAHSDRYEARAVEALRQAVAKSATMYQVKEVKIHDLADHMIVADDVMAANGMLLVAKGQETTRSLQLRLENFYFRGGIGDSLRVFVPTETLAYRVEEEKA